MPSRSLGRTHRRILGKGKEVTSAGAGSCSGHWMETPMKWLELDPPVHPWHFAKVKHASFLVVHSRDGHYQRQHDEKQDCLRLCVNINRDRGLIEITHMTDSYAARTTTVNSSGKNNLPLQTLIFTTQTTPSPYHRLPSQPPFARRFLPKWCPVCVQHLPGPTELRDPQRKADRNLVEDLFPRTLQ